MQFSVPRAAFPWNGLPAGARSRAHESGAAAFKRGASEAVLWATCPRSRARPYGCDRARQQGGPPEASEVAPSAPLPEHRPRPAASTRDARAWAGTDRPRQMEKASGRTGRQTPLPFFHRTGVPPRPLDELKPGAGARPGGSACVPHDVAPLARAGPALFCGRAAGKRCCRLLAWCCARAHTPTGGHPPEPPYFETWRARRASQHPPRRGGDGANYRRSRVPPSRQRRALSARQERGEGTCSGRRAFQGHKGGWVREGVPPDRARD